MFSFYSAAFNAHANAWPPSLKVPSAIEHLQEKIPSCYGAVITFGEKVLATMMNWKGQYEAATYEFIETPEETGLGDIECRLNLLEIADGTFKDGGHAMAWALKAAE